MADKSHSNASEKPITDLVATTADGRDITKGYIDQLDYLVPEDRILRERARGDLEVYERLLDDDQVAATFEQRRLSVIAHEWFVEAASEDPADIEAADWVRECLKGVNFDEATRQMLSAIVFGYAVAECEWEMRDDGHVWLKRILVRRQKRFAFSPRGELLLKTSSNPRGEAMPPRKFWTHRCGTDHCDDPYGRGIGGRLYWPCFFKRNGLRFWMAFLDRFGSPSTVATLPSGASEDDRQKALELVSIIQRDTGAVVPEGIALSLLESARSAGGDFGAFCDRMDAAISKVVLGQTMTTDDGSSLSQSKTHLSVRDQMLKADADALCESFNGQVVTWLTEWNFPAARPPKVWRVFEATEDLAARAQRDAAIAQLGYRPTIEEVREVYGGEWEPVPQAAAPQLAMGSGEAPEFAEVAQSADEAAERGILDQLDAPTEALLDGLAADVRAIVESAKDLEEVRERLFELAPGASVDEMAKVVKEALVVAELMGRAEISGEVVGGIR